MLDGLKDIFTGDESLNVIVNNIASIAQWLCYVAALIILIVKATQFMIASPEGKANIKNESINYFAGALILFGVGSIIKIVISMVSKLSL